MTDIRITPLTPDNLDDFFSFFDSVEFREHPDWSVCYCYSFHFTGRAKEWNRENNRSAVIRLVGENRMKGYLAYHAGRPVGWCNANNRLNFQRLVRLFDLLDPGHQRICSIVCFLIHPDFRRRGIARQLLRKIISDYSALEYDYIEAYPGKNTQSCEGHYKGPLELYMENGFKPVREFRDYTLVRKSLLND